MNKVILSHLTKKHIVLRGLLSKNIILDRYNIIVVIKGHSELVVNNKKCIFKTANSLLLPPNTSVRIESLDDDFYALGISLSKDDINPITLIENSFYYKHIQENPHCELNSESIEILKNYFYLLEQVQKKSAKHIFSEQVIASLISSFELEIAGEYVKSRFANQSTISNSSFYIFFNFIKSLSIHHRSQRNVEFYACENSLERRYFSHIIKGVSGLTPKQWINIEVLNTAKLLLYNKSLSIQEVADKLNFIHSSAFSAFFKSQTGITPREFRNQDLEKSKNIDHSNKTELLS